MILALLVVILAIAVGRYASDMRCPICARGFAVFRFVGRLGHPSYLCLRCRRSSFVRGRKP